MDTIAAIATAVGIGGIGIIRISGCDAIKIADKVFETVDGKKLADIGGYRAKYGKIIDENDTIDEAIALVFIAPHSYTGEDVVEISCHGGIYIVKKVLDIILKNGARLAEAGEFTKRAFINGKMDLSQAESVMNLISSSGETARKLAIGGIEGTINKVVDCTKNTLVQTLAELDVWADYPEECDFEIDKNILKNKLVLIINKLNEVKNRYGAARAISKGVKIAVVGKPNVGKSSLVNLLLGYQRAIVTDVPGTTRDVISEQSVIGDIPVYISDTAGVRDTSDLVEKIGIDKTKEYLKNSDVIFVLFDGTKPIDEEDENIISLIDLNKSIAIINKMDLNPETELKSIENHFRYLIKFSANTGLGMDNLKQCLYDMVGMENLRSESAVPVSERQFDVLKRAISSLEKAVNELDRGITLDAVTVLVNEALQIIGELTGENVTEEVINNIFSRFCVGK